MSVSGERTETAEAAAPHFAPGPTELAHLELILNGSYPLSGFMTAEEAEAVTRDGHLPDGTPWPVPVTLPVPDELADARRLVLTDPEGAPLAELDVRQRWRPEQHAQPDQTPSHHLAGEVCSASPAMHGALRQLRLSPDSLAALRAAEGGDAGRPLLAVVTDRPLHHNTLHQIREAAASLGGDHPADVLVLVDAPMDNEGLAPAILAAEPLLPPRSRFAVTTLPPARSPAGGALPTGRDALLAAHVARSYGATSVLLNRGEDGSAHEVAAAEPTSPVAVLRPSEWRYDTRDGMWRLAGEVPEQAAREEPADADIAETLALGRELPSWFTPARVATELYRLRPPRTRRGLTVFLTGLSGSGKSTIARGVADGIRGSGRTVTLLDGDIVRRLLSAGLTFSREDRDLNIRRIGYVASEITRHGGVAICAPIAPYAATRAQVRAMVEENGDFFLVHVATPLDVCEERDRKGLYAKARAGEIQEFTGISDPYEEPADAELVLDTAGTEESESVARVLEALRVGGWLPEPEPERKTTADDRHH
ncbi:sulfate adenylyltransferase [Haloactinospora alba]|uniref:Adenylyl-sulfate kinase n=1 Tax=Haloactinospora alba TaxID=405555 RepID=A0A543NEQ3_9ACTN|nr:adenylyl-sulfate kinase [Haloactinospora alba]TQN30327.1 sulfate adenylyltransferase [Haloactinospora alba]